MQNRNLFRQTVVENQLIDMGVPLRTTSRWMKLFTFLFLIFCGGIVTLVCLGSYSRKARVEGFLLPDRGVVQIASPREGRIQEIHITEGQHVETGELLFTVNVGAESANGDTIAAAHENLLKRVNLIQEQMKDNKKIALSEKEQLEEKIRSNIQTITVSENEIEKHDKKIDVLKSILQRKEDMSAKGIGTLDSISAAQRDLIQAQIDRASQERVLLGLRDELASYKTKLDNFDVVQAQEELEFKDQLLKLQKQLTDLEDKKAILVRAPQSGVVTYVADTIGSAVDTDAIMIRLLPEGSKLEAFLLVPSKDAGFIQIGTKVKLRYDAYPYQKFGTYEATVKSISQTTVSKENLPFGKSETLGEPVYVVTAKLNTPFVVVSGEKRRLQSGSRFKADLILEKRKLWQWLLGPIQSVQSSV